MVNVKKKKRPQNTAVAEKPANIANMDVQQEMPNDYKRVLCPRCGARPVVYKTINYSNEITIRGLKCACGCLIKHTEDRSKEAKLAS